MEKYSVDSLKQMISSNPIIIFGKGSKGNPQCGFTLRAFDVFERLGSPYSVVNIFDDPSIKDNLVKITGWPTTPQIFIGGEFIGGSDIIIELYKSGELEKKITKLFNC